MKQIVKLAALSVSAAVVSTAAQAQLANGDLVLGFTSQAGGVTQDYVVDLGATPTYDSVNTVLPLNGYSSTAFNSTFGSALDNGALNVGIVGGVDSSTG